MLYQSVLFGLLVVASQAFKLDFSKVPIQNENRIVGGQNAVEGQFPYMVSLRTIAANFHFCGGCIISYRWVLSAAHCTIGTEPHLMKVVAGTISRVSGGVEYGVVEIINHPDYNEDTIAYDVSVIHTDPIVIGVNVATIPLGSHYIDGGSAGVISGWGQTNHPGDAADILQYLDTTIISNEDCRNAHAPAGNDFFVFDHKICTFTQSGEGTCFGDSGSPLTSGGYVVGIASWVIPCAIGLPDAYDRVSSHYAWITQNID